MAKTNKYEIGALSEKYAPKNYKKTESGELPETVFSAETDYAAIYAPKKLAENKKTTQKQSVGDSNPTIGLGLMQQEQLQKERAQRTQMLNQAMTQQQAQTVQPQAVQNQQKRTQMMERAAKVTQNQFDRSDDLRRIYGTYSNYVMGYGDQGQANIVQQKNADIQAAVSQPNEKKIASRQQRIGEIDREMEKMAGLGTGEMVLSYDYQKLQNEKDRMQAEIDYLNGNRPAETEEERAERLRLQKEADERNIKYYKEKTKAIKEGKAGAYEAKRLAGDAASALVLGGISNWWSGMETIGAYLKAGKNNLAKNTLNLLAKVTPEGSWKDKLEDLADNISGEIDFSRAELLNQQYQQIMADATDNRGEISAWMIEQLPSAGSMLLDMGVSAGLGAVAGAVGATGAAVTKATSSLSIMGVRAAGNSALQAVESGATPAQALALGVAQGGIEVFSEKLFGGNPIYDDDVGMVNQLVSKLTNNKTVMRILDSKGFDIASEGFEEVISEILDPIAEGVILNKDLEMATPEDLALAFAGGVFLSVIGNVVEAPGQARQAKYDKMVRAVSADVISQASGVQDAAVQEAVQAVSDKLAYGRVPDARDIGAVLDAMNEAGAVLNEAQTGAAAAQAAQTEEKAPVMQTNTAEQALTNFMRETGTVSNEQLLKFMDDSDSTPAEMERAFNQMERSGLIQADDAGNYVWGGNENEAILNDGGKRTTGLGAGEQAGELAGGTGAAKAGQEAGAYTGAAGGAGRAAEAGVSEDADGRLSDAQVDEKSRTIREIKSQLQELGVKKVSAKEIGIGSGSEEQSLYVLPERMYTKDVRAAKKLADKQGVNFRAVIGPVTLKGGGTVDGVFDRATDTITVRADSLVRSAEKLTQHEIYHALSKEDSSLNHQLRQTVVEKLGENGEEKYREMLQKYADAYEGLYDMANQDDRDLMEEELLADAYAGMNRFKEASVAQYQEDVRQTVSDRRSTQNAAATERTTGPTEQRFSVAETDDGRAVAVVDSDILSSIDTTNWNDTKKEQAKAAAKTALLAFKDGVQVNGISYAVNRTSRREYTRSNDTERKYKKMPEVFADKMRAAANANDIITATTSWANDGKLKHPRNDNFVDFTHGKVLILAGNNQYEAETVVGITEENRYVFYDVVDMKPMSFKMEEEPSVTTASGINAVSDIQEGSSTKRVPDAAEKVKQRFSLSEPVEQTGTLLALHNMDEEKIMRTLDLGAWPSPSIAIVQATQGHTGYGEYSAIFPRSVIDPEADARNKVYGGDAWTPTHQNARVDYEVDDAKAREVERRIAELSRKTAGGAFTSSSVLRGMGIENDVTEDAQTIAQKLAGRDEVRAAYAADNGITVEPVYKAKEYGQWGNKMSQKLIDGFGAQELASMEARIETREGLTEQEKERFREIWKQGYIDGLSNRMRERLEATGRLQQRADERAAELADVQIEDTVSAAWQMYSEGGGVSTEIDRIATSNALRAAVDDAEVQRWAAEQIDGILGEPGIYNGEDPYTRSGNRKGFSDLHWEYTAENIVRAMNNAEARGANYWGVGAAGMHAVATSNFRNVDEMHAEEGRLYQEGEEAHKARFEALDGQINNIVRAVERTNKAHSDNSFEESEIIGSVLMQAAQGERTANSIKRTFRKEGYTISDALAEDILQMLEDAAAIPTGYFEAKPERVVNFEEAAAVLAPDNAPIELLARMRAAGMNVMEYEAGNEEARLELANSLNTRFSISEDDGVAGYMKREENDLMRQMRRELGADVYRNGEAVRNAVRDMTRSYMETGSISAESRQRALETMLENGISVDSEYYDQYREVKDYLRKQKITVPEDVKRGIADYNAFRKRAFGTLRLTNKDGIGIDTAYGELREMAPELFPEDTYNLNDQLLRMQEIAESIKREQTSVQTGKDKNFRAVMESTFNELADRMQRKISAQYNKAQQEADEASRAEEAEQARAGFDARQEEARRLLGGLNDAIEIGVLDAGEVDPEWSLSNTKQMQEIYREYAAKTPEDRRLDEGLYWFMQQKRAHGDVAQRKETISVLEAAQRAQDFSRDSFRGTEALDKIGVKVARSVTGYENASIMRARDKAAKSVRKAIRQAEDRLALSAAEKQFAEGIAAGLYSAQDIPSRMDRSGVIEMADYYLAGWDAGYDMIAQRKKDIANGLEKVMHGLFDEVENVKPQKALQLNYNTTQRNAVRVFGDELGGRINKIIFDPINQNEAEKIRWINRQIDDVREFVGQDGKKSKLTEQESALVQKVIEGKSVAEMVAGDIMAENIRIASDEIQEGKDPADAAMAWGLGKEQRQLAEKYAAWKGTLEELKSADTVKIGNAVRAYQEKFSQFYEAINDFLVAHGYQTIGFIKNYAPHMQSEETQNLLMTALQAMGVNTQVTELPTSIAGLTGDWKPNKKWNPYFLSRTTDITQFDIQSAYQSYVQYMGEVLYHTDDIMTVRQMSNYFRSRFAPEEIRQEIDRIQMLKNADGDRKREYLRDEGIVSMDTFLSNEDLNKALEEHLEQLFKDTADKNLFSNFVMYLDNYANILAGKQSIADRGIEQLVGRKILNAGSNLVSAFAKANVAGNLSSALNQSAQLANIIGDKGVKNTTRAFADIMSGKVKRTDFKANSDFLTSKAGISFLTTDRADMIVSKLFAPAEFADGLMSTLAVRSAYIEALDKGMSDKEAMAYADRYGRRVMGDRSKGGKAVAFASRNPVMQMVNVFQIEALNTWQHLKADTLGEDFRAIEREHGKKAAAGAVAGVIVKTILSAFILNRLGEELYGGTPAPFDIIGLSSNFIASGLGLDTNEWIRTLIDNGMEKLTGERVFDTERTGGEFDFWAGAEDLTYNVTNDIPFVRNVAGLLGWGDETLPIPNVNDWYKNVKKHLEDGMTMKDAAWDAGDLASQLLPGGKQLSKTAKGIKLLAQGGDYTASGRLKFSVDASDPMTFIKALLFGPNSLTESRSYWAAGGNYKSESQTAMYQDLLDSGMSGKQAERTLNVLKDAGDKQAEKFAAIAEMAVSDTQKDSLYGMTMSESKRDKLDVLNPFGIGYTDYADFTLLFEEAYPGENVSQERAENVINGMDLTNAQKAAMFQLVTNAKQKKDGSIANPYSQESGLKAYELIADMPEE